MTPNGTIRAHALGDVNGLSREADQGHALGAAAGREPHHRHDREPARLGDLAPARLGRADHRVRAREGDGSVEILKDERVNTRIADAFEQEGADAWYADGAARALPRPRLRSGRLEEGRRHSRRLVRFRLDPRLRAGGPEHFPSLAGIKRKPDGGPDTVMYLEGSDQHRGWFQSSLLESCGTRGRRAVRRGADARLRARRARPQDVEVARQRRRAAGRDQAVRRRHPAHVGLRVRLCRRPAHRPGNPQDHGRDLSQAAQHHPLDARLARAFPRRGPRRAEQDAGARAADAASARRARRRWCARPMPTSTTSASSPRSTRS